MFPCSSVRTSAGMDRALIICVSPDWIVVIRVPGSGMILKTIRSRYGDPSRAPHGARRWYSRFRARMIWSLATYSATMNGPLPTGFWLTASPSAAVVLGEMRVRMAPAA